MSLRLKEILHDTLCKGRFNKVSCKVAKNSMQRARSIYCNGSLGGVEHSPAKSLKTIGNCHYDMIGDSVYSGTLLVLFMEYCVSLL